MNYYPHHIGDFNNATPDHQNGRAGAWLTVDPFRPASAPTGPGVYAFLIDGIAVYVGQSLRLRERIYNHKIRHGYAKDIILPWGTIPNTSRLTLKIKESRRVGDWAMWEIRLIHRLQPKFNKTHLNVARAS